jgi:hypothetical protein
MVRAFVSRSKHQSHPAKRSSHGLSRTFSFEAGEAVTGFEHDVGVFTIGREAWLSVAQFDDAHFG